MTVKELRDILENYADDAHVCIALTEHMANRGKYEIHDCWCDGGRSVNVISGASCCKIDEALWSENDIVRPK